MEWIETWIALCAVFLAVCAGESINTNKKIRDIWEKVVKKEDKDEKEDKNEEEK